MSKFETIGIERQYQSVDKAESNRNFLISCRICCNHGRRVDCDRCGIAVAHESVQAIFGDERSTINNG